MTVVCAWCQRQGRSAVLGQKEPLDLADITHGICDEHELVWRAEVQQSLARRGATVAGGSSDPDRLAL